MTSFDCPEQPCTQCPDGTFSCPKAECVNNQCVSTKPVCNTDVCAPQEAFGYGDCDGDPADPTTSAPGFDIPGLDLTSRALHTTGTVGAGDRSIVAVFTLQPVGTSFGAASNRVTAVTRGLTVPGATPVGGSWFGTWGTRVKVRATPSTSADIVGTLPAGIDVAVRCQRVGQLVEAEGYRNEWWAYLPERGGYMSNIYISSPDNKLPGVGDCS
jgi:hypothetical protein